MLPGSRLLVALSGFALLISACSPGVNSSPSSSQGPPRNLTAADVDQAVADLAGIGVDVRARPGDASPLVAPDGEASAVHLLRLQVRGMALERLAGGGISGKRLDEVTAAADGGPMSALIAGWAKDADTPASSFGALLLRDTDRGAEQTAFPTLALVAFLADVTRGGPGVSRRGGNALAASDLCGEISAYVGDALDGIITFSSAIPAWLQNLVLVYAPLYADDPDLFQHTIGALALLVYATTLAKPWSIQLQADPTQTRYTVEGVDADPVEGEVDLTIQVDPGYADEVVGCADLAGAQLVSIDLEGADVAWLPAGLAPHASPTIATGKADDAGQASLSYQTASECKEAAQGATITDQMSATVVVDRQEMKDLRDAVEKILLGDAYGSPLGGTVATIYQAMKPQLDQAALPRGFVTIDIVHHDGPCATPTPNPSASASAEASGTAGTDCTTMLPADEVQFAVGISIGSPTDAGEISVFSLACVWEDVQWSLQGNGPLDPPVSRFVGQFAGMPCDASGGDSSLIYCLNLSQGVVGGLVYTSRWGFILTTAQLSLDQVVSGIVPILDRHGN